MNGRSPSSASDRDARRTAYLYRLLQLNPLDKADEIIALRSGYLQLGRPCVAEEVLEDREAKRSEAQDAINAVRSRFWSFGLTRLHSHLAAIDVREFPDLQYALQRLQVVADCRERIPLLTEHPDFDRRVFSVFKRVLVLSPREAAHAKEDALRSLQSSERRRAVYRMVKLIERELPELYELERDWLDSLKRRKRGMISLSARSARDRSAEWTRTGGVDLRGFGWLVWLLVILFARLLIMGIRS